MGLLDIDEKDIKESSKEDLKSDDKKHISLPIGDSLLNEVNRNAQILINNPELVKVPKNILQNEYSRIEKQLRSHFNIKNLDIEVNIPLINNRLNVMLSLNTNNLLDEQKELVYNSIGTVFADKFDIEFKVREDVGNDFNTADEIVSTYYFKNTDDLSKFLHKADVDNYQVIGNSLEIYTVASKDNLIKVYNFKNTLQKEGLYDKQKGSGIKGCKRYDVSRVGRCSTFRSWFNTGLEGRYEPRGGSDNRNETFGTSAASLGLRETTFFKEKLDICIRGYDAIFKEAIIDKDITGIKQLINEFFNTFSIPKINTNIQKAFDNKSLSVLLKNGV